MKQIRLYWLILGFIFLFFSCSADKPKKIDRYAQIQKKWTAPNGDFLHLTNYDEKYIAFENGGGISVKKNKRQKFSAQIVGFGRKEVSGTWKFLKGKNGEFDSLQLTYVPDAVVGIDSVAIVSEGGEQQIILTDTEGNTHYSDELNLTKIKKVFEIKMLTESRLVLKSDAEDIEFSYISPSSSIS